MSCNIHAKSTQLISADDVVGTTETSFTIRSIRYADFVASSTARTMSTRKRAVGLGWALREVAGGQFGAGNTPAFLSTLAVIGVATSAAATSTAAAATHVADAVGVIAVAVAALPPIQQQVVPLQVQQQLQLLQQQQQQQQQPQP